MARQANAGKSDSAIQQSARWIELQQRTASAILLVAAVLTLLTFGGVWFLLAVITTGLLMHREWLDIMPRKNVEWQLIGLFYITLPCVSVLWLRNLEFTYDANGGFAMVLYLFAVVAATDIFAYFGGRIIGGQKLAPAISPGKTWSGAVAGLVGGVAVGICFTGFIPFPESREWIAILSAIISVLAQAGDLFESWVKRQAGVKDSGRLIPGHGGMLDRLDGYMFTTPLLLLASLFFGDLLP